MFEQLGNAIDELDIPTDSAALVAVLALRDRLDARIGDAVAAHDRAGRWELDGATSMTAWLTDRARLPRRRHVLAGPQTRPTTAHRQRVPPLPVPRLRPPPGLVSRPPRPTLGTRRPDPTPEPRPVVHPAPPPPPNPRMAHQTPPRRHPRNHQPPRPHPHHHPTRPQPRTTVTPEGVTPLLSAAAAGSWPSNSWSKLEPSGDLAAPGCPSRYRSPGSYAFAHDRIA
jgi:hypothetical protein